ncbi:MAG: tripartite tricarboxylate transporter substrate-binding protein [Burkholderiales bacterium]
MKAHLVVWAWAVTLSAASTGVAQPWPARPITFVVPFSAGGPTDTLARLMSEPMRRYLGQTLVVDNVTGAGGSIGVARVARAAPDGYTLSIGHWGTHVVNGAYYNLTFDLLKDLEPVAQIATNPQVVVSKMSVPAKNLKELIGWIKTNQDKVQFGTGGVGGASHIAGIYFLNRIGAKTEFVPYRGGAPAMQALLSGEIDLYMTQVSSAVAHVRAGKARAYLVTSKTRQAAAPEIPTVDEAGLPGLYTAVWHGIWVPKGTPRDINMKLNAAIVESLTDDTLRKRFADLGQDIPPREEQTQQALASYHKAEIAKWWPLMKAAGIKAE